MFFAELRNLAPQILEKQETGQVTASLIESDAQRAGRQAIGDYTATITRSGLGAGQGTRVGVMFLQTGLDEFLVAGSGEAQVTFSSEKAGPPTVGILSIDEEVLEDGRWVVRRRDGDESSQGQVLKLLPTDLRDGKIYRVRLYRY